MQVPVLGLGLHCFGVEFNCAARLGAGESKSAGPEKEEYACGVIGMVSIGIRLVKQVRMYH